MDSYSYEDLLQESTPDIGNLVLKEGYQLPLDITITDQQGRVVISLQMTDMQDIRVTSDGYALRKNAILPVFVTVTDRGGRTWKKTFGED